MYSANIMRKVLYGEVNWGVDKVYYNLNSWLLCFVERRNFLGFIVIIVTFLDLINTLKFKQPSHFQSNQSSHFKFSECLLSNVSSF